LSSLPKNDSSISLLEILKNYTGGTTPLSCFAGGRFVIRRAARLNVA
jgi:hypothetical protein